MSMHPAPAAISHEQAADTPTPEQLSPLRRRVASVGRMSGYGAVPTSVFPPAVRAALNVVDVFALNFGPYSRFTPL